MTRRAVFFLSDFRRNDPYLSWLRPFLASYFRYNSLPLICMYAGLRRCGEAQVRKAAGQVIENRFGRNEFGLYINWDHFDWCARLGFMFSKAVHRPLSQFGQRTFRKLSLFLQEDYDEVLYVDIDSVVLRNIEPLFDLLERFDVGFGDTTQKQWVYSESSDLEALFGGEVPYYNSDMMLFKKNLFTKEMLEETVRFGCEKKLFHSWKGNDQAIINLAVMMHGLRHVHMKSSIWGRADFEVNDGQIATQNESQPYVVHWAGNKRDTHSQLPHIELLRHFDPDFSTTQSLWVRMLEKVRYRAGQLSAFVHYLL